MSAAWWQTWRTSLQWRLLLGTVSGLLVALVLAGFALTSLFRDHVTRQFRADVALQLEQLTARMDFAADGQPTVDQAGLTDPRWGKPYSGLYWQVNVPGTAGLLRSRSLWDHNLRLPADAVADGDVHTHQVVGPLEQPLLVLERSVHAGDAPKHAVATLVVGADMGHLDAAVARFAGALAASLAVLLVLLVLAAVAQLAVGLAPLRRLTGALSQLSTGQTRRLQGEFPAELKPLVDGFNRVLERDEQLVARARTQAGNLAHAVKTPLAVMANAAQSCPAAGGSLAPLAVLVTEQVEVARRQVDWHLTRARVAAAVGVPGVRVPVAPLLASLMRVMGKVHADRQLALSVVEPLQPAVFLGEEQDLAEMLGNVLDNACKWARTQVRVSVRSEGAQVVIVMEDDGPGLPPEQRLAVLQRGVRADEQVPGSGLGLAIVNDLALLYGGSVRLAASSLGGVCAELVLPGTAVSV